MKLIFCEQFYVSTLRVMHLIGRTILVLFYCGLFNDALCIDTPITVSARSKA
jgi:hypothetical protein